MIDVLLVDDDPLDRQFICMSLRKVRPDLSIREAGSAKEAFERFEEKRPDLTLLDISMPHVDGLSLLTHLRTVEEPPGATIYMLSGSTDPRDKARALAKGADGYRVKPASLDQYEELARELSDQFPVHGDTALRVGLASVTDWLRTIWKPVPPAFPAR